MEEYVGVIKLFAFSRIPQDWLPCDGRLVQISQHQALYSLIGNIYGGDGRTNFALPDLRNCIPIGAGLAPALGQQVLGQKGTMSVHGTPEVNTLGLSYAICANGVYPSFP